MSITSPVLADISRSFTPTILASMMRLLSKIPQQFGRTILMLQYLCPSRVSPQAAVFLVFLEWDSFGFSSRDPTIPLHSNLFGISHTQKRASHSRNSGYSYYVLQRKVFIEGYAAPLVRSIVRRSDDDSTARTARRSRTYLVRPLAALAVPCCTVVLPAVLPPCHQPNEIGSSSVLP